jgi:hypothetical protein
MGAAYLGAKLAGYDVGSAAGLYAGSQTISASMGLATDAINRLGLSPEDSCIRGIENRTQERKAAGMTGVSVRRHECARSCGSSVPWIGFPVGYAVSGILLAVFEYFAMRVAQILHRRIASFERKKS